MHEDARKLNETGGKLFEALTECVLEDIFGGSAITAQPRCEQMHIKPDFVIGSPNCPSHVVLVTHATAINNAGHKVDRGVEELFEIKTRFQKIPVAINLIWHSPLAWIDGYIRRMDEMFDINWVAFRDCSGYETSLPEMINTLDRLDNSEPTEYKSIVRESSLVADFRNSIAARIKYSKRINTELWKLERSKAFTITFSDRETETKIGKDLISITSLRPKFLRELFEKGRVKVDANWTQEIGADVLQIRTLRGTFASLHNATIERFAKASTFFGKTTLTNLLCDISTKRWATGTTVEGVQIAEKRIETLFAAARSKTLIELVESSWDPSSLLYSARCWPLYIGVAIIKALADKEFGFLNAQRRALGDTHSAFRWDLLNRYARGEKDCLNRKDLLKVVQVFQDAIQSLRIKDPRTVLENENYVAELALHRVKDESPLMLFVERTLSFAGIGYDGWPNQGAITQCPFAVRAALGASSGRTAWHFRVGEAKLLHVLSNYSSTHKDKEYCAKARLARYEWAKNHYKKASIGQLGLILDGRWKSSETSMFTSAGICWFSSDDPGSWTDWLKGS
jgi:hypothetical protein